MLQQQDRWIWPFELTEKIGEGGMGVVYRARYVVNDKTVAVKLIPADVTDETLLSRFEREVEILKTLRHPNIVHCFGGSCENKRRFYAMELVEGGTLEDLLKRRGRLPWELVAEFAKQICSALAYAHERGVIHRDLKPANFLLNTDGKLKLSDFGLATLQAGRKITAAGRTAGTYEYMAPEQISGKELSPRTDLYALGCVLYELLCGDPPFLGATSAEVLHAHLKRPAPRVIEKVADCPAALDNLICELMNKRAEDRPASAADVAARFRELSPSIHVTRGAPRVGVSNRPTPASRIPAESDGEIPPVVRPPVRVAALPPFWVFPVMAFLVAMTVATGVANSRSEELSQRAIGELSEQLRSADFPVRAAAAQSLGRLAADSPLALQALIDGISDSQPAIRRESVIGLRNAGRSALPTMPLLQRRQREEDQIFVRIEIASTIEAINSGPDGKGGFSPALAFILALLAGAGPCLWIWRTRYANSEGRST